MNPIEYLNNSVWCKVGASTINGVGVIAIRDIKKGQRLTDYFLIDVFNQIQPKIFACKISELRDIVPEVRSLILDRILIDRSQELLYFISPNSDQILQSFMNHSDDANSDGQYATRDIKKGEEVTENFKNLGVNFHYATQDHMNFLYGDNI